MAEHGVPRQLEFFRDQDFSPTGEHPTVIDGSSLIIQRANTPPPAERVKLPPTGKPTRKSGEDPFDEARLTRHAAELIRGTGLNKLANKVTVIWNNRMRTAAGRAFYEACRVELNPGLLALEGIDNADEVDRTLRHELAHLVAYHRKRSKRHTIAPHGPEWRAACAELGIPGEARCHTLPFKPRKIRKNLIYSCPVCESEIPRVRRFRQPVACYDCCKKYNGGRYDQRFRLVARRTKK